MVTSIANGLVSEGHEVGYITSGDSDSPTHLKIDFRFSIKKCFGTVIDLIKVRSFTSTYDVIVSFDVQPAALIVYLANIGRSHTAVIHTLGTYSLFPARNKFKKWLMQYVFHSAAKVFVINEFVKRKIEESSTDLAFRFSGNHTFVPVGVDTQSFAKRVPTYTYAQKYIISVGAIKERKDQFTSIKAFNAIKNTFPDLKYVIVGSTVDASEYVKEIYSYIRAEGLEDRVILVEDVSDDELQNLYSGAEFFVMVPQNAGGAIEGFGMVYLEAALCGVPSIGTFDTGAEAAIVDRVTGLLVEQHNVDQLAAAMALLLNDGVLRATLAKSAFDRAITYDWKYVIKAYEKELSYLLPNK